MPWTGKSFKTRHFKKAGPTQAKKAAKIATAMVEAGEDEGLAIATGIARAKGQKPKRHRRPWTVRPTP